jgi:hypothetical protein
MRGNRPGPVRGVTVTLDGVTHYGTHFVQSSNVYVQSPFGAKATELGVSLPDSVAKLLLSELVRGKT